MILKLMISMRRGQKELLRASDLHEMIKILWVNRKMPEKRLRV
jgi:hypothetical protein